jgi:hypothetical protein
MLCLCPLITVAVETLLFFYAATAQIGPWPPHWGFFIVFRHAVGLLWTSDQPVAKDAPRGIRTPDTSNKAAAGLRLRPRGHQNRRWKNYSALFSDSVRIKKRRCIQIHRDKHVETPTYRTLRTFQRATIFNSSEVHHILNKLINEHNYNKQPSPICRAGGNIVKINRAFLMTPRMDLLVVNQCILIINLRDFENPSSENIIVVINCLQKLLSFVCIT